MKKVITIGSAMLDLFIQQEALACPTRQESTKNFMLLEIGKKMEISHIIKQSGGGATNAAVSFSRLGFAAETICKIGPDCEGKFILDELAGNGVKTNHIIHSPTEMTGLSIILPCPAGERTVLAYRGANSTLQEKDIPASACDESDVLYITSLTGNTAALLLPITRHAKKQGKIVATNPGTSQLAHDTQTLVASLAFIDIFILNSSEAQTCWHSLKNEKETTLISHTNTREYTATELPALLRKQSKYHTADFDLRDFFTEILARGPQVAAVTNGAEGVYVAQSDTIYFHPSMPSEVVCTVGAGDAFGSCFVSSLLQEKSVPEALIRGSLNAASVIAHVGAKMGVLTADELEKRAQKTGLQLLQSFAR